VPQSTSTQPAPRSNPTPTQTPQQSFVVSLIPAKPAEENTMLNVVVGSLGVAGVLLLMALVLGVGVAGVRVVWQKRHPAADDHLPPVA